MSIRAYILLQLKLLARHIEAMGIYPSIGAFMLLLFYVGAVVYAFSNYTHASYFLMATGLYYTAKLSARGRNDFLKGIYTKTMYVKIRLTENLLIGTPVLIALAAYGKFIEAIIYALSVSALVFAKVNWSPRLVLPTPFSRHPFEFTVGFRKQIALMVLSASVLCVGLAVDNFNLGAFALIITALTSLSFYANPEPVFYVWNEHRSPSQFLWNKLKIGNRHLLLLSAPIWMTLIAFYPSNWVFLLLFQVNFQLFLSTMILAKYSAYPNEIGVTQSIIIALSVFFPPLLLATYPAMYKQAKQNLSFYLS